MKIETMEATTELSEMNPSRIGIQPCPGSGGTMSMRPNQKA
jgi:hypothetical protein